MGGNLARAAKLFLFILVALAPSLAFGEFNVVNMLLPMGAHAPRVIGGQRTTGETAPNSVVGVGYQAENESWGFSSGTITGVLVTAAHCMNPPSDQKMKVWLESEKG